MSKKELRVVLRVYPGLTRASKYGQTKLELFENSLISLKKALNGIDYYFSVIQDSCPFFYSELISRYFPRFSGMDSLKPGNRNSFRDQLRWAAWNCTEKYVALIEDDYIWKENAFKKMIDEGLPFADFITPLDHPDYVNRKWLHRNTGKELCPGWVSRIGTCLTFLCRTSTFKETLSIWRTYYYGNLDISIGIALTRRWKFHKYILPALVFTPFQLFFGKKFIIASPSVGNGLAIHV